MSGLEDVQVHLAVVAPPDGPTHARVLAVRALGCLALVALFLLGVVGLLLTDPIPGVG